MLESKYLTKDGIIEFLQMIYKKGYNYACHDGDRDVYILSVGKPIFHGQKFLVSDSEYRLMENEFVITLLKDLLDDRNYIKIEDYIDCTDWSKVEVDTPVLVKCDDTSDWNRRYFAKYENGVVYAWSCGATEWTNDGCDPIAYDHAKLAK